MRRYSLILLMVVSVGVRAESASTVAACRTAFTAFLSLPAKSTLTTLDKIDEAGCWTSIEPSNSDLDRLNRWVGQGNRWAAQYSAKHLKQLDGGNLEDALVALGRFSDRDMERLLLFENKGLLSKHELTDALTMLPLSLSDNPRAQLDLLKARRSKVARIFRADLRARKAEALAAIDDFVSEIKMKR